MKQQAIVRPYAVITDGATNSEFKKNLDCSKVYVVRFYYEMGNGGGKMNSMNSRMEICIWSREWDWAGFRSSMQFRGLYLEWLSSTRSEFVMKPHCTWNLNYLVFAVKIKTILAGKVKTLEKSVIWQHCSEYRDLPLYANFSVYNKSIFFNKSVVGFFSRLF